MKREDTNTLLLAHKIARKYGHRWASELTVKTVLEIAEYSANLAECSEIIEKRISILTKEDQVPCILGPSVSSSEGGGDKISHSTGSGRLEWEIDCNGVVIWVRRAGGTCIMVDVALDGTVNSIQRYSSVSSDGESIVKWCESYGPRHIHSAMDALGTLGFYSPTVEAILWKYASAEEAYAEEEKITNSFMLVDQLVPMAVTEGGTED
jgi:hypothetical protein